MSTEPTEVPWLIEPYVDAIAPHVTDEPQTPSKLGRKAGIATVHAGIALRWMAEHNYVIQVGRGSWARFRARKFGEYNRDVVR